MSRDTQIIVRVPAEFQLTLSEYQELMERRGVVINKADAIIRLAQIGAHSELDILRNTEGQGDG